MRLPNPVAAYRRWAWRNRCRQAGIDVEYAERLNEIGKKANAAGVEIAMVVAELAMQGYKGESLIMEMRRRVGAIAHTD